VIEPFVSADWLQSHADGVVTADVRWYLDGRVGRDAYEAGHVPGAVFVDLDSVLAAPPSRAAGRHPLPDPQAFADDLGTLGISDDDTVIAYDDAGGVIAARLAWMLRAIGRDAALLDGGISAWMGQLESGAGRRPRARSTARPWPAGLIASPEDAADSANSVLDARDRDRYRGELEPIDRRAGHIPGAHSLPCRENVGPDGRLLSADELRRRITELGVQDDTPVVSYCGSGVTACHNLLVLEHVGVGHGRLYPGSWSQWSSDPARPVATGEDPGRTDD
jgi:thiosulfate/3-mercaptopyruvate sulfurtransferase